MKYRGGFVSNSSSSSFMVRYPNKKLTMEEVKEWLGMKPSENFKGLDFDAIVAVWFFILNEYIEKWNIVSYYSDEEDPEEKVCIEIGTSGANFNLLPFELADLVGRSAHPDDSIYNNKENIEAEYGY